MTITLCIDGSAKANMIGAGLVIYHPDYPSPLIKSFHQTLNHCSTSSLAELLALQKALEWIQAANPTHPIQIVTDSMEVAIKTLQGNLPDHLMGLFLSIQTNYSLSIQQAQPIHEKMILLAHNASRSYLPQIKDYWPYSQRKITNRNPFIWLCLCREDSTWRVTTREGESLTVHQQPIKALYTAVQNISKDNPSNHALF
jgi:ribonuclease HI